MMHKHCFSSRKSIAKSYTNSESLQKDARASQGHVNLKIDELGTHDLFAMLCPAAPVLAILIDLYA